jgi:hypothetical protein
MEFFKLGAASFVISITKKSTCKLICKVKKSKAIPVTGLGDL